MNIFKSLNLLFALFIVINTQVSALDYILFKHPKHFYPNGRRMISDIEFLDKKNEILTVGSWNDIFVWNMDSQELNTKLNDGIIIYLSNLIITKNSKYIAVNGLNTAYIFDFINEQLLYKTVFGQPFKSTYAFLFSDDDKYLFTGGVNEDNKTEYRVYDIATGKVINKFVMGGYFMNIVENNKLIFYSGNSIVISDLFTGEILDEIPAKNYLYAEKAFGKYVYFSDEDNKVFRHDIETKNVKELTHLRKSSPYYVSHDYRYRVFGDGGRVSIERTSDGEIIKTFLVPGTSADSAKFSPDYKNLALGIDGDLYLYDISDVTSGMLEFQSFK